MPRRSISEQLGDEPIEVLTRRPSRAKRNREWERQAREKQGVVTYRGVPRELNERLKKIAKDLGVPVGEVARKFLEYGLEACRKGDLVLKPKAAGKHTLFPSESD
jgi:hypothetical protein